MFVKDYATDKIEFYRSIIIEKIGNKTPIAGYSVHSLTEFEKVRLG